MTENALAEVVKAAIEDHLSSENEILREELREVRQMFAYEDQDYLPLSGLSSDRSPGLTLKQLKEHARTIRERVVGVPIIKRAVALRTSYIFSKGVVIPDLPKTTDRKRGQKSAIARFYENPVNKANFFDPAAYEKMERAAATEGMYLLVGDSETNTVRAVPLDDISEIMTNPDYPDEIWAYKRSWDSYSSFGTTPTQKSEWIYNDTCPVPVDKRPKSIVEGSERVPVSAKKTIIDIHFNTQVGWPLGVPDALSAVPWARIYTELLHHGKVMTEALARIAFKVVTSTPAAANRIGAQLREPGSGKTAAIGTGNELLPLSSAGRTYDFNGIRPIAAQVATAMEVSIVHLLSDPGAAGSSYGSAANLDLPTKRAMVARQNLWAAFFERVLLWGAKHDVEVTFPSLDDPDPYRDMQRASLGVATGLLYPQEGRAKVLEVGDFENLEDTLEPPAGYLQPNNEDSLARADIDSDGVTVQASPDQGVSNNAGIVDSGLSSSDSPDA